jgi:hypothetical protein
MEKWSTPTMEYHDGEMEYPRWRNGDDATATNDEPLPPQTIPTMPKCRGNFLIKYQKE